MRAGMVGLQLGSSVLVDNAGNASSNDVAVRTLRWDLTIDLVQNDLANFNNIRDGKWLLKAINSEHASVMLLAT